MITPAVAAEPEILHNSLSNAFVNGAVDSFEFAPGQGTDVPPITWVITAPDGDTLTITRVVTIASGSLPTSFYLDGTPRSGNTNHWTAEGNLHGAAADGTWTIQFIQPASATVVGSYTSYDGGSSIGAPGPTLAVQSKAIHWGVFAPNQHENIQTWNWHKTTGTWNEPSTIPGGDIGNPDDLPNEGPEEDPQYARYFAPFFGPISQHIPAQSHSETVEGESIETPSVTTPATCTVGPCTTGTPIGTPFVPIPRTCAPLDLVCFGPGGIPSTAITTTPAICDAAGFVCLDPQTIPSEHLGDTPEVTVAVNFNGLDILVDAHAAELTSMGPFTVPTPLGPLTICGATCPYPVLPEGGTDSSVTVTVTLDGTPYSQNVPLSTTF